MPPAQGPRFADLVLDVGGLVELFVVVDAEGKPPVWRGGSGSGDLRREEARSDGGHDEVGAEVVVFGDVGVERVAGDLGVVPVDGEGDGRVAEDAEVEGVVGVLPDVLAAEDGMLAEGLLEAGVELVADSRGRVCRMSQGRRRGAARGRRWSSRCWRGRGSR